MHGQQNIKTYIITYPNTDQLITGRNSFLHLDFSLVFTGRFPDTRVNTLRTCHENFHLFQ